MDANDNNGGWVCGIYSLHYYVLRTVFLVALIDKVSVLWVSFLGMLDQTRGTLLLPVQDIFLF